jgi:hypothetical protein
LAKRLVARHALRSVSTIHAASHRRSVAASPVANVPPSRASMRGGPRLHMPSFDASDADDGRSINTPST